MTDRDGAGAPQADAAADGGVPDDQNDAPAGSDRDHRTRRSSLVGHDAPEGTYVESQVIMTTVRTVAPFAFTYGLFLTFHGGGSPGGGFQGGAIVGTTVLMLAFAFGIEPTRDWLSRRVVVGLASGGVLAFALIGLLPLLAGGRFLEHKVFGEEFGIYHGKKYALEGVEIVGIMPIVASIVIVLFFAIATGFLGDAGWHDAATEPGRTVDASEADDGGDQE